MKVSQTINKTDSFNTEVKGKTHRRTMINILIGAVAFALLAGTVLVSVYFGIKMTKDNNNKEYQAIYIVDVGVVHQNITVTDREEIFTTDASTIIVDFSTITFEKEEMVTVAYVVTDIWLHPRALGQRTAQMCEGKIQLFLQERKVKHFINLLERIGKIAFKHQTDRANKKQTLFMKDVTARAKRFDEDDYATTYKATRDAYLQAENELKLATGPYKAARDAYVAATATYTKSLYE